MWREALVAGIMPKDKDATSNEASNQAQDDLDQDAFYKNSASNTSKP